MGGTELQKLAQAPSTARPHHCLVQGILAVSEGAHNKTRKLPESMACANGLQVVHAVAASSLKALAKQLRVAVVVSKHCFKSISGITPPPPLTPIEPAQFKAGT